MPTGGTDAAPATRRFARRCVPAMIGIGYAMFSGPPAHAIDSQRSLTNARHQIALQMLKCMRARMSASRTIWYNEAQLLCQQELAGQHGTPAAGKLLAAESAAK